MSTMLEDIVKDGELLFGYLVSASLEDKMGGMGDCKHFEITNYPARFRHYILLYLRDSEYESASIKTFVKYLEDGGYLCFTGSR